MYLARIQLSLDKALRLGLRDPYDWHKFSWSCYPEAPDAVRDFLTRLDFDRGNCTLFLLGKREPLRPAQCEEEEWACRLVASSFLRHPRYRFDVRVNPTRKLRVATPDGGQTKNGRREALLDSQSQRDWLTRKAASGGFTIEGANIDPAVQHGFSGKQGRGTHFGVRFTGLLRVTQPELFAQTYAKGLGSAKAFGFGLLLLQPVSA